MEMNRRHLTNVLLIIAGIAGIGAIAIFFFKPDWDEFLPLVLGITVFSFVFYVILDRNRIRRFFSGRHARYGSNALIFSAAFLGVLIILNYLSYQNPFRKDLTEDKNFTLAPETIETLKRLDSPVFASAFFTPRISSDEARELLDLYKFHSNGKFEFEFIDPEANPIAAEQAQISRDGTIVLKKGGYQEPVSFISEQEITAALVRLISPELRKVYFLTGHGEYNPEDTDEEGYSQVKRSLDSRNYSVDNLNLLSSNEIPDDANVIVIAGPRVPIASNEVEILNEYIMQGGSLFVMQEPLPVTEFEGQTDYLANYLEEDWGIIMGNDIVIDLNSMQIFAPFAAEYSSHPITIKLENIASQYPTVRSVTVSDSETQISRSELVKTGQQSWAETDLDSVASDPEQAAFNQEQDLPGPVSLAVVAEIFTSDSKLVVMGDSDFANNSNFFAYANGDLFVNVIDWLAGKEDIISLTPKETTRRSLMPLTPVTSNLIMLVTVVLIPCLALVTGFLVWFKRRQRG